MKKQSASVSQSNILRAEPYEPQEDSFLLEEEVRLRARGRVLDMGTGSGIQALAAAAKRNVKSVLAVDQNASVIAFCRKTASHPKITYVVSDLFCQLGDQRFDTIIFNPPYLPQDGGPPDKALIGGRHGWEVIARFLQAAGNHLNPNGIILLLFSSRSDPSHIEELLSERLFVSEEIARQHVFFEDLLVCEVRKSTVLNALEKRGVTSLVPFARGKRGRILIGNYNAQKVAVKVKYERSDALNRMANEALVLRKVNKINIGPRLLFYGKDYVVYSFVKGMLWRDWIKTARKSAVRRVLRAVLKQCRSLDVIGITKEEMHHPVKHIIIGRGDSVTLVDFERSHESSRPKNVTQFCEFLSRCRKNLVEKGIFLDSAWLRGIGALYRDSPNVAIINLKEAL